MQVRRLPRKISGTPPALTHTMRAVLENAPIPDLPKVCQVPPEALLIVSYGSAVKGVFGVEGFPFGFFFLFTEDR